MNLVPDNWVSCRLNKAIVALLKAMVEQHREEKS
jgi:hypothetical protein